jgi:sec-independent protein translocase protein TatA
MGLDNPIHIAFLVLILLLVFGAKRLPELGRSLGTGMREFKQSVTGETHAAEKPQQPMLAAAQPQAPAETPVAQPAPVVAQPTPAAAAQPAPAEAAPVEQQQQS